MQAQIQTEAFKKLSVGQQFFILPGIFTMNHTGRALHAVNDQTAFISSYNPVDETFALKVTSGHVIPLKKKNLIGITFEDKKPILRLFYAIIIFQNTIQLAHFSDQAVPSLDDSIDIKRITVALNSLSFEEKSQLIGLLKMYSRHATNTKKKILILDNAGNNFYADKVTFNQPSYFEVHDGNVCNQMHIDDLQSFEIVKGIIV